MTAPDPTYYKAGILVRILETRNDYPPVNAGQPLRYISADNISFFSNEDAAELVALGRATYYDWEPSLMRRAAALAAMDEANRELEESNG